VQGGSLRSEFWSTNGEVNALAISGNTLYVGGEFTHVGPVTGPGVPVDATTGLPVAGFPAVDGCIYTVASDGAGGWFVGGSFQTIGGAARLNLAHVLSNMTVTPWNPQPNASVLAIALSGSTVYFGGLFTDVGGTNRPLVAAADATNGALTSFDAAATPTGFDGVHSIVVQGGLVYVGGQFTSMGGQPRNGLAALNGDSGQATTWNASVTGGIPNVVVLSLAANATTLYLCGNFFSAGGQSRSYIAAVDLGTGLATSWNPQADDVPLALALDGATIYVAGQFTHIGGAGRGHVAALDASTGTPLNWDPDADRNISALAVTSSTVYVGGDFSSIGVTARSHVAAIDAVTGLATSWNPAPNDWVGALGISGSAIYVGGIYRSLGGAVRHNLAAFDLTTGAATAWNPDLDGAVQALAINGSTLYAGGWFTNVGGMSRPYVAALDLATGVPTTWNPGADGTVEALATDGSIVYLGGSFDHAGSVPRSYLAAIDATSGLATPWDPGADAPVHALALNGAALFAGGSFTHTGGYARNHLAAIDPATGLPTSWNPNADYNVDALMLDDATLYAGGGFGNIGGQARNNLAALSTADGAASAWNPNLDGGVRALALSGWGTVLAGGSLLAIGGVDHPYAGSIDALTGQASAWNPNLGASPCPNGADAIVNAVVVSGQNIVIGGGFSNLAGLPRGFLAVVGDVTTAAQVSLTRAEAVAGEVRLAWQVADAASFSATLERRQSPGVWRSLGPVFADGYGRISYEDRAVTPGVRYDYRLGVFEVGVERFYGETSVAVPAAELALAIAGSRPHPASDPLTVELSLPDGAAARLELLDVSGRRLASREVGGLGTGRHTIALAAERVISPGMYLLRLSRSGRSLTTSVVVVP
jgi:hypothetical protein